MTPEHDNCLCDRYPRIFRERREGTPDTCCMARGFECSGGWLEILNDLCRKIDAICKLTEAEVIAKQVKQKMGLLRFYWKFARTPGSWSEPHEALWRSIVADLVRCAEDRTTSVCEQCGREAPEGPRSSDGYVHVLCDGCLLESRLGPDSGNP